VFVLNLGSSESSYSIHAHWNIEGELIHPAALGNPTRHHVNTNWTLLPCRVLPNLTERLRSSPNTIDTITTTMTDWKTFKSNILKGMLQLFTTSCTLWKIELNVIAVRFLFVWVYVVSFHDDKNVSSIVH
jgi:hypothetical protein